LLQHGNDNVQLSLVAQAERNKRIACWLWLLPVALLAPTIAFIVLFAQDETNAVWLALMIVSVVLWACAVVVPCAVMSSTAETLKRRLRERRIETESFLYSASFADDPSYWLKWVDFAWGVGQLKSVAGSFICLLIFGAGGVPLVLYLVEDKDKVSPLVYLYIALGIGGGILLLHALIALLITRTRRRLRGACAAERRLVVFEDALFCGPLYVQWPVPATAVRHLVGFLIHDDDARGLSLLSVVLQTATPNGAVHVASHHFPLPRGSVHNDELTRIFADIFEKSKLRR
jgi:hypothetical protein